MKLQTVLSALGVLAVLATPVLAQPILPPFSYDFEMEVQCTTSATAACPLVGPFTNLSGDFQDWISDSGGTTSNPTGPQTTDHNPGTSTGKYLYIESSTPTAAGSDALLLSPLFDLTGVVNPQISFWYHMLGAGMGTMHLDLVERLNEGTDAVTTTGATFTTAGPSAAFVPAHVGTQITISGSALGNDGVYTIMTVLGPNSVDVAPPFVMAETGLSYLHEALTQDVIPAWQDNVDLWQQRVWLVSGLIGGGNSNSFQVIIRSFAGPVAPLTGSTFLSDMAIDDFAYIDLPDNDVGVVSIDTPGSLVAAGFHTVSVTIQNFGGLAQTTIPVSFDVDMGVPISETYMGSIAPGATDTFTFMTQADLSASGPHTLAAYTALPGDGAPANDGTSIGVQSLATVTAFPYLEDFDPSGVSDWISGGSNDTWALGTPAKASLNGAASGVNCWVNGGLSGQYLDNEQSFVVGPVFDFSAVAFPTISLSAWWECEWSWDGAVLQSSIDGGASWQNVGALNDPNNWYNDSTILGLAWSGGQVGWSGSAATTNGSGGWVTATHPAFDLGGQSSVLIRVAFGSDASTFDEGFAFDDVFIYDNPPVYPGTATDAILLATGVNGPPTSFTGYGEDVKTAMALDNLVIEMSSPTGVYDLQPFVLLAQPFATGMPPVGPVPAVWIDLTLPYLVLIDLDPIFSQLIVPGGTSYGAVVPPGLAGQSLMFQAAVVTPAFAVTDGYEIQIL